MRKKSLILMSMLCCMALFSACADKADENVSITNETENGFTDISTLDLQDGKYEVEVILNGGSNRAKIESPAVMQVNDSKALVQIKWSSPYYDYMIVADEKFMPVNTEGNSVFEIPLEKFDCEMSVSADTTAMSEPHQIEYTLKFLSDTITRVE